ncbi:hypothetical protein TSOC_013469, partial [Tetrabaena socialis]
ESTAPQVDRILGPDQQQKLTASYQQALEALSAAEASVANVSAGLHDVHDTQTNVSARLSGNKARCTGRKRKLSPSVFDCNDAATGFAAGSTKADTPTQELLPASRSELRSHQLAAVRWLASLEQSGGGGVLADEAEADRQAEVVGLLSHLASTPPEAPHLHLRSHREQSPGSSGGASGGGAPAVPGNVCLLLAPSSALSRWGEAISAHVDGRLHRLHLHDGSPASGSGGSGSPHRGCGGDGGGGLDAGEAGQHLHLLGRLPAPCRVLLSAGDPAPSAGDGIWLLLQLLAPSLQRPLWEAVGSLQQVLLTSGGVGAQCQQGVMAAVHSRLWALLRPLVLHRRARDVELEHLRATATSLNLYDHFSAARGEHAAA